MVVALAAPVIGGLAATGTKFLGAGLAAIGVLTHPVVVAGTVLANAASIIYSSIKEFNAAFECSGQRCKRSIVGSVVGPVPKIGFAEALKFVHSLMQQMVPFVLLLFGIMIVLGLAIGLAPVAKRAYKRKFHGSGVRNGEIQYNSAYEDVKIV